MRPADMLAALTPWEYSPTAIAILLLVTLLYRRGYRHHPPPLFHATYFWLGMLVLYAASQTQFDYYAQHAFFMHRLQQMLLHFIGPLLLMLARPGAVLAAGMPVQLRTIIRNFFNWRPLACLIDFLNHPFIAVLLLCAIVGGWLLPAVEALSMLDWRLYRLMNASMVLNGLMFWGVVLNNHAVRPTHLAPGTRLAMLLAVIPPQIAMGLAIFSAPQVLYPLFDLCGRAFAGMSALADQQIGGLILWVHAGLMSVIGILLILRREWLGAQSSR